MSIIPGLTDTTTNRSLPSLTAHLVVAMSPAAFEAQYEVMCAMPLLRTVPGSAPRELMTTIFFRLAEEARRSGRKAFVAWQTPTTFVRNCYVTG